MKLPKASKVNFGHMGGMLIGYKVADVATTMVRKKDATTGFLDGTMGGIIKVGGGILLGMYSKSGSLLQGIGDGVAFNGGVTLLRGFGVSMSGLQGGRLGLGADARYNRLNSQIAGGREAQMGEQRERVYANVA
jgi:hypothetical protein